MYISLSIVSTVLLCLFTNFTNGVPSAPLEARFLTTTIPLTITTPIPPTTSPAAILAILQDPVSMITLNPLVQSYTLQAGVTPTTYSITDKLLLIFSTSYSASFTNTPAGMDTVSSAAGGLTLAGHWSVANGVLTEEIDVTGSELVLPFVKGEILSSHQSLHTALMAQAAAASGAGPAGAESKMAKVGGKGKAVVKGKATAKVRARS
ncbi:hypothetical protein MMC13_005047 [Lambiella insularis]|nr:hypothetical protein [Lambiella insularis]